MLAAKKELFTPSGGGYQISRSVRLRNSATGYFTRTAGTPTSQNVWTLSMWVKLGNMVNGTTASACFFGANQAGNPNESIKWDGTTQSIYYQASTSGGTNNLTRFITNLFRDPSAWYHLVFQKNASAASGTGCFLAWVNGVAVTFTGGYTGTQAAVPNYINVAGSVFNIGAIGSANSLDCYLAEVNFVDGQALTPTSFGETNAVTGVWQPKKYNGTYGNNGFYLNFSDNSAATAAAIGKDYSGNGNNFTPNNISVTAGVTYDSMIDVPTPYADGGNGRGNYCTLNPLSYDSGTYTLSNANLNFSGARTSTATAYIRSTLGVSSGKWYWEVTPTDVGGGPNIVVGIQDVLTTATTGNVNSLLNGYGYGGDGYKNNNAGQTAGYGATYANGDVIGVALDLDGGTITFYKNNASQGVAYSSISGTYCPVISMSTAGVARTIAGSINCGQRPFTYTPPTGFKALNTQNLPDSTIVKGNKHFDATTYTGTGASQSIVNGGFQPDLTWFKVRSTTYSNTLLDALRNAGANALLSDSSAAELANYANGQITAFNSNGVTINGGVAINESTRPYVAWQWNAGGSTVTNTSGSISAQVRANPTAGFSIVTYTGTGANATVGHGLGVAPSMIITKNRDSLTAWWVYHTSLGNTQYLVLNTTAAAVTSSSAWNNTSPTSSVFSIGAANPSNANQDVAYCFAEVKGYSAFGSYTGNGSTDGTFVYLGFRPRFIMIRNTSIVANWNLIDTARDYYNTQGLYLFANSSAAEGSTSYIDILSNGFKLRTAGGGVNGSGNTFIYAAFAENPFKNSLAR